MAPSPTSEVAANNRARTDRLPSPMTMKLTLPKGVLMGMTIFVRAALVEAHDASDRLHSLATSLPGIHSSESEVSDGLELGTLGKPFWVAYAPPAVAVS